MEGILALLILFGVLSFGGSAKPQTKAKTSVDASCPANVSGRVKQSERPCGDRRHLRDLTIPRISEFDGVATSPTETPDD